MTNRLAKESSLYLRQHAENPVDWWPYCDEALKLAEERDLPLFISIGYSACHWCHVMEKECFEDLEVASLLNRSFVCIKVDREERPDIDALYMEALQASTGGGGWPMSVFATADARPFYTGTYFPKHPGRGMPGFMQVLDAVEKAWSESRSELDSMANQMVAALKTRGTLPKGHHSLNEIDTTDLMNRVVGDLLEKSDEQWGGFGGAPKFPQPHLTSLLLRHYYSTGDRKSLDAALSTLDHIASGGIFDHLGGGFSRYSVDRFWTVPHFEKMLYDQAGLISAFTEAYLLTKSPLYEYVVRRSVEYVDRHLRLPTGGIATAQDADSDGEEGAYYIFRLEEIEGVLGAETPAFIDYYGVTKSGNFEGRNILRRPAGDRSVPDAGIASAIERLLAYRARRNPPATDDKVVCEWNAKYATALLLAGGAFDNKDWCNNALELVDHLNAELWDEESGQLYRVLFGKSATISAMASDYLELSSSNLSAFSHTGKVHYLHTARSLLDRAIERFWDHSAAGFFTSPPNPANPLPSTKDVYDTATLSTNSVAAELMVKMAQVTSDANLMSLTTDLVELLINAVPSAPASFGWIAWSALLLNSRLRELVIPGKVGEMAELTRRVFLPDTVSLVGDGAGLELFQDRLEGEAYLCVGMTCDLPTHSVSELRDQLAKGRWITADGNER